MQVIIRKPEACYACKTCLMMCSFHHTGAFWPERSSIRVSRDTQKGAIRFTRDGTCDMCVSESEPLCVKYCQYDALKVSE